MKKLGFDIGSTTMKCVLTNEQGEILFSDYRRHQAKISETGLEILDEVKKHCGEEAIGAAMSGSAGMGIAEKLNIPFVQEVYAEKTAVERLSPGTDAGYRAWRRGCKDSFLDRRIRNAYERHLCRRNGSVYRPDGLSYENISRRDE